jgi:hypothetical protein
VLGSCGGLDSERAIVVGGHGDGTTNAVIFATPILPMDV